MIDIREGGLDHPDVQALLHYHHVEAHSRFPEGFGHALPPAGLADPAIRFFAAWEGDALLGIAALKRLSEGDGGGDGEIKSMRTAPAALRRGVARLLLGRLIEEARRDGWRRISLETGTTPDFVAANRLYEAFGFVDCPAFASYPASPHNRFMTMGLE